ncbi:alpha/beta fold hydrolase [Gulosibacter molinativorax]|uniref:AB hydrolase-1 domain-containing protein n=1 Tax=Gulosibacter molinativorax TaxID=256821 RepID=A0ABT7C5X6_9MICO|nr:alpha/beta fold hydrolase [Gulosibacter molinativorax]MDJ1370498.1 hypothetical protein [Gulosibacter molinativorax]QUY62091.1 Hypotetical protein [Gulosibacter molinativorax]
MSKSSRAALAATALVGAAALVTVMLAKRRAASPTRTGTSVSGMEYIVVGDGPKTVLLIPGGPGSEISGGAMASMSASTIRPLSKEGYSVWVATRVRNMPHGHSVADMADDYAKFIRDVIGGPVDLIIGESFGGLVSFYLAANHPEVAKRIVIAGAAAKIAPDIIDIDLRFAEHKAAGRHREAAATLLEYVVEGPRFARLRQLLAPLVVRSMGRMHTSPGDFVVETAAEARFDATDVLGRIDIPVLIISAEEDRFFPPEAVRATAAAIPRATHIEYSGIGHLRLFSDRRFTRDIVHWDAATSAIGEPTD